VGNLLRPASIAAALLALAGIAARPGAALAVASQSTIQPVLGITDVVQTYGMIQDIGTVDMFAGTFAPGGSLVANGQLLSISQNQVLFSQIGTSYGGNGTNTFALPDLDGRIAVGTGQGGGLSYRTLGQGFGSDTITLSQPQIPLANGGFGQPISNTQPSLPLTFSIATRGVFPTPNGPVAGSIANPLVGEVFISAAPLANGNLVQLNGATLNIAQNQALFSLLGTTYGGNGVNTFQLPNADGRTIIGAGSGPGLTPRALGATLGSETTTLTSANLPGPYGSGTPYSNMQPSLALHYMIAVAGLFPTQSGLGLDASEPLLGQIALFAGATAPNGWLFADGQTLSIAQNQALFAVLGTTYGGNGVSTFDLPDFDGRGAIGADDGSGLNGLSGFSLGQDFGTETLQLTSAELPVLPSRNAVPEPASFFVLLAGLLLCGRGRQAVFRVAQMVQGIRKKIRIF